jgi:hypothetical protein
MSGVKKRKALRILEFFFVFVPCAWLNLGISPQLVETDKYGIMKFN